MPDAEPRPQGAWDKLLSGIDEKIGRMAKLVRTRPAASEYYYSYARQADFTDLKKPEQAQIILRNKVKGVALRRITIIFDTPPDANYAPHVAVTLGKRTLVEPPPKDEQPYQNADLSIDLMNGLRIGVEEALEFYFWNSKPNAGSRSASVFVDLGEA